ncbi:MAG: transposase [Chloroflexota bacterium]
MSHRHGGPAAQERTGHGGRSPDRAKKGLIEQAYREAEGAGLALFCQDEAGPYQAIPQPGVSWQPETKPACQPHEYIRGGTAKLLTLFRPATGALRSSLHENPPAAGFAQRTAVTSGTNAVLHPWLQAELTQVLAGLPAVETAEAERPAAARWATWLGHPPITSLPPLRAILVWDNLAGHRSWQIVHWLFQHGVIPLYTPLSGSWLNMAESLQRIVCGPRGHPALAGQHPQSQEELITWLDDAVAGWNAAPTPFAWGDKRQERRADARRAAVAHNRRLGGSGAVPAEPQSNAA